MKHKHAAVMMALANDASLEVELQINSKGEWYTAKTPNFDVDCNYRIKNKHQALIDLKTAKPGTKIEFLQSGVWINVDEPSWFTEVEYRVKPEAPKHVHQELMDYAYAHPEAKWEFCNSQNGVWWDVPGKPFWDESLQYRVKKEKVAMYQWAVRNESCGYVASTVEFYATEDECAKDNHHHVIVQRLDYTKILVEK